MAYPFGYLIKGSFGLVGSEYSFVLAGSDLLYMRTTFFYLVILPYLCTMIPAEHLIIRELKTWRSYGIAGKGPIEDTLIKNIGDEHLLNIIRHLEERYSVQQLERGYMPTIYETMHDEVAWRMQGCWQSIEI